MVAHRNFANVRRGLSAPAPRRSPEDIFGKMNGQADGKGKSPGRGFAMQQRCSSRRLIVNSSLMMSRFSSTLRLKSILRSCFLSVFRRRAARRRRRLDFLRRYFMTVSLMNKRGRETRRNRWSVNTREAPLRAWCLLSAAPYRLPSVFHGDGDGFRK